MCVLHFVRNAITILNQVYNTGEIVSFAANQSGKVTGDKIFDLHTYLGTGLRCDQSRAVGEGIDAS